MLDIPPLLSLRIDDVRQKFAKIHEDTEKLPGTQMLLNPVKPILQNGPQLSLNDILLIENVLDAD